MVKWLAVNEDDMIRFICDDRKDAMICACDEARNDIEQGFDPDMYRFIHAEYIGDPSGVENTPYGVHLKDDIYSEENWRLV